MTAPGELDAHARALAGDPPLAADVAPARVGAYHGYAELVAGWAELERRGARARCIGRSVAGEPMWMLEIGPADAGRVSVLLAGIHPIEWIGVETGAALLARLVADPPRDRRVLAFPLINVDGYRTVESNLRAGRRRFVRANHHGVDLNRNWPTHFRSRRRPPWSRLFGWNWGGSTPLSEPEVAAVAAAIDDADRGAPVDVALSLHSIGEKVLTPWGGRWRAPADRARLRRAAARVRARLGGAYAAVQSSHWVPGAMAHGMELDHMYGHHGAVALLVELSRGGATLRRPASLIQPFRWFNPAHPGRIAARAAIALEPFLRGRDLE